MEPNNVDDKLAAQNDRINKLELQIAGLQKQLGQSRRFEISLLDAAIELAAGVSSADNINVARQHCRKAFDAIGKALDAIRDEAESG